MSFVQNHIPYLWNISNSFQQIPWFFQLRSSFIKCYEKERSIMLRRLFSSIVAFILELWIIVAKCLHFVISTWNKIENKLSGWCAVQTGNHLKRSETPSFCVIDLLPFSKALWFYKIAFQKNNSMSRRNQVFYYAYIVSANWYIPKVLTNLRRCPALLQVCEHSGRQKNTRDWQILDTNVLEKLLLKFV